MSTDTCRITDGQIALEVSQRDGDHSCVLTDLTSGRRWGPVQLLHLEVLDKPEQRKVTLRSYRTDLFEAEPGRLHVAIGVASRGIRLGFWVEVVAGQLRFQVDFAEVYEDRPQVCRLGSVQFLPGLVHVSGLEAKILLGLNTGTMGSPHGKPALRDRFMIYGEQSRWELLPTLPMAAARDENGGMMLLAAGNPGETYCEVACDGAHGGEVQLGMQWREGWSDPVDAAPREIRWIPLKRDADLLHDSAAHLRRHIIEDLGKKTIVQRCAESPELADMMDATILKLFFACENTGIMMNGAPKSEGTTFRLVMTCAEAEAGLRRLKAAGLAKAQIQMVGWNPSGHDGMWPSRFPIDRRIGGESGLRQLIAAGRELGYGMQVHDNHKSSYRRSPEFDEQEVVHDIHGPMGLGEWGGGITYILADTEEQFEHAEREMRRLKELGLTGPGYLDGMGNPLHRDYHPRHRRSRSDYARGTNRLLEIAKQVYGAAGTECGFLYCCIPADTMVTGGSAWMLRACSDEWPVKRLMERRVPLWDLALHGLIIREDHDLDWAGCMRAVLFGAHPRDEWSTRPGIMSVLDDQRIARLVAKHQLVLGRFARLQSESLVRWEETGPQSQRTVFSDGTEVAADFATGELRVGSESIVQPAVFARTMAGKS
jgi:hypothetical protein